jgi:hypothetical protein
MTIMVKINISEDKVILSIEKSLRISSCSRSVTTDLRKEALYVLMKFLKELNITKLVNL